MKRIVWFMHVSLDGFVAGPAGEMDWIKVDDDMFEYAHIQTEQADTALYARVTYELMDNYWPTAADRPNATKHDKDHSAWYNKVNKIIISKTMEGQRLTNARIISNNISDEIKKLKQGPGKGMVIFGSPSLGHILSSENLIDDYWLFVNPIILGQGIPLFKGAKNRTNLKLELSKTFSSGVVGLHYEVIR
ncbi:dihydrofolate reductase family protein [Paraflavitalea speifideaquila]|uniref:dihydrofolate reductase family protein n=1 Tax=Paraflavitalea speifideaquila TaxID=3076558 RepID=UPI0028E6008C|nr:dihydrofolate reductase family protein [Paraflavitalea speifideiaquila]